MSQSADIPIPPGLSRRYGSSKTGREWLALLPRLIQHCLDQWQLELDIAPGALPGNGYGAIVLPVRRRANASNSTRTSNRTGPTDAAGAASWEAADADAGATAVLKIAYPHDEALTEPQALALWNGHGAVRLLATDEGAGALLLERLDAARSLEDAPMDEAVSVWGGLVRRLSLVPDGRQEWQEFGHVAGRAEQWSDELPESWEQLGRPFPRWLLEAALEVCQTRGAVGRRSARDVLVHTDLHYLNILARIHHDEPDAGGSEPAAGGPAGGAGDGPDDVAEGWAAIDPQPMIGEAEFAVAPLLWNRIRALDRSDPGKALLARCRDFSVAAGLDAEVSRQWALVRAVENTLDQAEMPRRESGLARYLWVASTLAGGSLPDLPRPHELPEPG